MGYTSNDICDAVDNYMSLINFDTNWSNSYVSLKNVSDSRLLQGKEVALPYRSSPLYTKGLSVSLKRIFKHIKAGRVSESILNSIYVINEEGIPDSITDDTSDYILNNHKTNIENFINYIAPKVKKMAESYTFTETIQLEDEVKYSDNDFSLAFQTKFILTGLKGSGKTILINYLTSCFSGMLDDNQIIWIRVDLTKPIRTWTVLERFQHQTVKIFYSKYLCDDKRDNFTIKEFREFLEGRHSEEEAKEILKGVQDIKDIPDSYYDKIGDNSKTPDELLNRLKIRTLLFKEVQSYCLQKDYGFLYILDGLDQLVPDTFHEGRYSQWLQEALELFFTDTDYCGAFILSMRKDSFKDFSNKFDIKNESLRESPRVMQLKNVNPYEIYHRRFECAKQFGVKIDKRVNLEDVADLLLKFMATGIDSSEETVLERVLGLLSGDIRNLMHSISMCLVRLIDSIDIGVDKNTITEREGIVIYTKKIIELLSDRSKWQDHCNWKAYEAMECLVVGDMKNLHTTFIYKKDQSQRDGYHITYNSPACFSGFFPNLYSFSPTIYKDEDSFNKCPTLLKVRILQYLNFPTSGRVSFNDDEEDLVETLLFIDDVIESIVNNHHYSKLLIKTGIHELNYFGCVDIGKTDGRDIIILTPVGKFCVEKLIYNHNYLINCIHETQLPLEIINNFRLIKKIDSKYTAISKRLYNLLTFIKYIEFCEQKCAILKSKKTLCVNPLLMEEGITGIKRIINAAFEDSKQYKMKGALIEHFKNYASH